MSINRCRRGWLSATSAGDACLSRRVLPASVSNTGSSRMARSSSCSAIRKGTSSQASGCTSQSSTSSSACHRTKPPFGAVASCGLTAWQIVSTCRLANVSSGITRPSSSVGISRHASRTSVSPGEGIWSAPAIGRPPERLSQIRQRQVALRTVASIFHTPKKVRSFRMESIIETGLVRGLPCAGRKNTPACKTL